VFEAVCLSFGTLCVTCVLWPVPYIHGVYTVFLAGKSPNLRSYAVYMYMVLADLNMCSLVRLSVCFGQISVCFDQIECEIRQCAVVQCTQGLTCDAAGTKGWPEP